jgi:GNAT superfamily N-acetyltransferase
MAVTFKPLSKNTWTDLQTLFGKKGACGGCWCMYWRLPHKQYETNKGQGNKERLKSLIHQQEHLGVVAFDSNSPIAWCSASPKSKLPRLNTSRLFKNKVENKGGWSITCLYVHKDYRGRGMSGKLISAAADYAFGNGATNIEAYPIIPKSKLPAVFAWVGFVKSFEQAGFKKIVQVSDTRVLMQLTK